MKDPTTFPGPSSSRSASFLLMPLKNHLGQEQSTRRPPSGTREPGRCGLGGFSPCHSGGDTGQEEGMATTGQCGSCGPGWPRGGRSLFCLQRVGSGHVVAGDEALVPCHQRPCLPPLPLPEDKDGSGSVLGTLCQRHPGRVAALGSAGSELEVGGHWHAPARSKMGKVQKNSEQGHTSLQDTLRQGTLTPPGPSGALPS